jgi:hypothetical protein
VYLGMVPVSLEELNQIVSDELDLDPHLRIMIRSD